MKRVFIFMLIMLFMTACTNYRPTPDAKETEGQNVLEVMSQKGEERLAVHYHVKGKNVYVECFIPNFSFNDGNKKLLLYVDGKKMNEIKTAAFVVKDLEEGIHTLTIEVLRDDLPSGQMKYNWQVEI
ncbi:hypothetical protein [Metabacillus fastidiosus]|uniref:Lipoprotein n=1 Tax=Metabacillus fastidiosus TaxID=1458 RepID=A0ABU6P0N4_9BACI|nr:hypothetical protein [Metabacillus fastidiosus]MED4452744.1 hypothetical protein [Metabacillus fastidiosus]